MNWSDIELQQSFAELPDHFYSVVEPQGLPGPYLISVSEDSARLLGLDAQSLATPEAMAALSGNHLPTGAKPVAAVYAGHQFGVYVPQLGDGRAISLGELQGQEIQLKGAGQTPYSRFGDGRAVLRSSIREYLGSEAMAGLGIPTTRALALVGSDTPIYRETVETAAVLARVAESHIRFGSFEYFHYHGQHTAVRELADHVIERHFPALVGAAQPYAALFQQAVSRTADLIAHWQAVGFCHGVLNTDNMSILGQTLDYGPYGFLDDYVPGHICNHSDHQGRYAFDRQPGIGLWNLSALGRALSSLLEEDTVEQLLKTYQPRIIDTYTRLMHAKLGLEQQQDTDQQLISDLLGLIAHSQLDYTLCWRRLCDFRQDGENTILRDLFVDRDGFTAWSDRYRARLRSEQSDDSARSARMKQVNPKYILRNYLLQNAIEAASEHRDYSEIERLLQLLRRPFDEQPEQEHYAHAAPDWGKGLEISCSS